MQLHVLGGGTPTPTSERFGSAFAVELDSEVLMFDCGPAATHKLVKAGLRPTDVSHLWFTHHHFDHDVDLPCLLLCRWDQGAGREETIELYGPAPTRSLTDSLIGEDGAFAHDWRARIGAPVSQRVYVNRGGTLPRQPPVVRATDIDPGFTLTTGAWSVRAASARHVQPYLDSLAYRLDTDVGSIVFTGDTEPCSDVVALAAEADLLLCMCWDHQDTMDSNGEATGQCGTTGAAQMARDARVKRLVLVHTGPALASPSEQIRALDEISRIYQGDVVFTEELQSLSLPV